MTARLRKLAATRSGLSPYTGACVGGSTVINDALCFRPPPAQDAVLADLAASRLGLKRALFGGMRALALTMFYGAPAARGLCAYNGPFGTGSVTIADAMAR